MTTCLRDLEAWFVSGSQRLYGDDVLGQVDEHAARIAAHLDGAPDGRKTIVGHWRDPVVTGRLGDWSRAAAGWHEAPDGTGPPTSFERRV